MGTLFSDGFEDGTWSDDWNDHSEASHSPAVNTNRSYAGSYSLDLSSSPGSSTKNEVRSASTWSGPGNEYSAQVNKYNDGGDQNSRFFGLVDSANPDRRLEIYESSYQTNDLVLREKDTAGTVINEWTLNSNQLGGGWYKHSITTGSGTASASAGGNSVSGVTTTADWSTIDCRIRLSCSGWGSGHDIDIACDAVMAAEKDPAAPTSTSQSVVDDDTIDLSWADNADNEDQYRIQVSEDGGAWSLVGTVAAGTTAYTYTAAVGTNEHRFRVRAENTGNSAWDYTATVATDPTGLAVSSKTDTSIDLSWTGTRDSSNYRVLRAQTSGTTAADYTEVGTPTTASFSDTGLENGEKYYYRVQSVYTGTNSQLSAELGAATDVPAPALDSLDATVEDEITVSYTLNDNSADGQVDIYRSTDGTKGSVVRSDSTVPSTSSPTSHTWTDTALADGEEYHYTVDRATDHVTSSSLQKAATTVFPGPTGIASSVSGDDVSLSWTDNADGEDGYRVYRKQSSAASYTQAADLPANTTSHTDSGLLDGEEYDHYVEGYTEHTAASTAVVTNTTVLPDVTGLSGDASVEDEITLAWNDVTDYGDYHVQHRVSGSGSVYTDDGTVGQAVTSKTITGLADGEKYDFRVRAETEHVTSAWLEVSPVTLLPAPTSMATTVLDGQAVDTSWVDNADNEDRYELHRREKIDGSYGAWAKTAEVAANTTSHTDDPVWPDSEFQYKARAVTEHVTADSTAATAVTGTAPGKEDRRVEPSGTLVEVEHPATGKVLHGDAIGRPRRTPVVNDLPETLVPVRRDDKWSDVALDGAEMRVWEGGAKQPVERLDAVTDEEGRSVLEGRGGVELLERTEVEYSARKVHLAMEDIINQTSYIADVTAPTTATETEASVQSPTTNSELRDRLLNPIVATEPLELVNGALRTQQTCWTVEAEDSNNGSYNKSFRSEYSGGTDSNGNAPAITLQYGTDYAYWDFTPAYDIPEADVGAHIRQHTPGSETPEIVYKLGVAGNSLQELDRLPYSGSMARLGGLNWRDHANSTISGNGWTGGDLKAGTKYRLRLDVATAANDPLAVDVVAPADNRFSYTFDDTVSSTSGGNALSGPELYPASIKKQFEDFATAYSVVGGRVDASTNISAGLAELALSNDKGSSWTTKLDATTLDTSFANTGATLRFRVELSRHGTQAVTPTTGISPQELQDYDLDVDVDYTPLVTESVLSGSRLQVLSDLARRGGFVFEYTDGTVSAAKLGDLAGSASPSRRAYEVRRSTGDVIRKAVIRGVEQRIRADAFTSDVGAEVQLDRSNITPASETVYDPADGTKYERGQDYEMDYASGAVTVLSSGSMADATTYESSYSYKPEGSYDSGGSLGVELQRDLPGLTTPRACDLIAKVLVERLGDPIVEAMVDVPAGSRAWSVIEELDLEGIPTDGGLHLRRAEQTPDGTKLYLGSRKSADEMVASLETRLADVSRSV